MFVEVQWACRDDIGDAAWQHYDSGTMTNVQGGSSVGFTLSVSAPSDLEVGVRCLALVIADEVGSSVKTYNFHSAHVRDLTPSIFQLV